MFPRVVVDTTRTVVLVKLQIPSLCEYAFTVRIRTGAARLIQGDPQVNKADLIDELARRMGGDHQLATEALENTLDIIVRTVAAGESITIMGFGIFEKKAWRPASHATPTPGSRSGAAHVLAGIPSRSVFKGHQGTEPLPRAVGGPDELAPVLRGLRKNGVDQRDKVG